MKNYPFKKSLTLSLLMALGIPFFSAASDFCNVHCQKALNEKFLIRKTKAGTISKDSAQKLLENVIETDPWDSSTNSLIVIAIKSGADVNTIYGSVGRSLLMEALDYEYPDLAIFLIDKGADINATDADGMSPLHFAAMNKIKKLVGILLDKGAWVNLQDNMGRTPWDMTESSEIQNLLKKKGGKPGNDLKK